jgi:hypothetical protein
MSKSSQNHAAVSPEGARILPFSAEQDAPSTPQSDVIVNLDGEDAGVEDLEYLPPEPESGRGALVARVATYVGVGLVCFGIGWGTRHLTASRGPVAVVAAAQPAQAPAAPAAAAPAATAEPAAAPAPVAAAAPAAPEAKAAPATAEPTTTATPAPAAAEAKAAPTEAKAAPERKAAARGECRATVRSNATAGLVRWNGRGIGKIPMENAVVPCGDAEVSVWREGFRHAEKQVSIKAGSPAEITINLRAKGSR